MLSQFYVLSSRGDTIISRDFRGDVVKGTAEIFFRKVKHWGTDPPPLFVVDSITFAFLKRHGLYFVATTQQNVPPAYVLETLQHVTRIFRDFCGVLSEEAMRRNFVLIYEILDELIDCGYPQHTSTEKLKQCIRNEAVLVEPRLLSVNATAASNDNAGAGGLYAVNSFRRGGGSLVSNLAAAAAAAAGATRSGRFGTTIGAVGGTSFQKTVPSIASHRPVGAVREETENGDTALAQVIRRGGPLGGAAASLSAMTSVLSLTRDGLMNQGRRSGATLAPHRKTNEIFVDILERLTVVLNSSGQVLNSSIDGCIQMKSYLAGHPLLRVALNEDLIVRNQEQDSSDASEGLYSAKNNVVGAQLESFTRSPRIDNCNFHECVDVGDFESSRVMLIQPPDGEFVVMNYRITDSFRLPFSIRPTVEQTSPTKLDLAIELRADIPSNHYGGSIVLTCPVPKSTSSVSVDAYPQHFSQCAEYVEQNKLIVWSIKNMQGGTEAVLRARISLSQPLASRGTSQCQTVTLLRKEMGPISLTFEIPMYNVSNVQVRYLRVLNSGRYKGGYHGASGGFSEPGAPSSLENPLRWVRYVTQSASYVCRL